ncbi:MAG: gluconate 2-dehydrogenase subunit 3 family protein [Acidobacteria bacterium]|nr:gluconate 2-dehydrogenase subunit 3 family protein [Acidobacteriota bacterium]
MKRRQAIQALIGVPAAAAIPLQVAVSAPAQAQSQAQEIPKLATVGTEAAGEAIPRYFPASERAALARLADAIVPGGAGRVGAREAGAVEFLDFLISQSPAERQERYRAGLARLQREAQTRYGAAFEALSASQADALLGPLRAAWTYAPPADEFARFLDEVKEDLITATMNSREYAAAQAAAGRRGTGIGTYWYPVE